MACAGDRVPSHPPAARRLARSLCGPAAPPGADWRPASNLRASTQMCRRHLEGIIAHLEEVSAAAGEILLHQTVTPPRTHSPEN